MYAPSVDMLSEAQGLPEELEAEGREPPMDETDLQALVRSECRDAIEFIESTVGRERAKSIKYYRGDPLGNEEEGRSQVVSREVRDSVNSVLPSLIRVFMSAENAVEYVPEREEDVAMAKQATDYVNYVIQQDNAGFEEFSAWFKDSLYQTVGIMKYWRDESMEVTYHEFSGLDEPSLAIVMQEPGTEITEINSHLAGPASAPGLTPPQFHDVTVKRTRRASRVRIMAVPPEEFLIDRRARSIDEARYVGHRQLLSVNDLVALGYDRDLVEGHVSSSDSFNDSDELRERHAKLGGYWQDGGNNEAEKPVLYVEHYLRVDWDDDDYAELRRVCTIGESYEVVAVEPCDERPFAALCPDPEPHTFFGTDIADLTKDLQFISTNLKRAVMDSLAQSIYPRTAVVEGKVNIEDVLNTELGAIMRQDAPGMITPYVTPFLGKEALPVLEMIQAEKDGRVGTHNMALDADALQSTTSTAVNAQVNAANQRLEMIARTYAEGGVKRLFRGLLRLVSAHQDQPRMVRLRNEWVQVDPAQWNSGMDVAVNVGLGRGMTDDRIAALREVLAMQRAAIEQYGPGNPLVGVGQLRNTLGKLLELSGFKDTSQFFKPLPIDYEPPPPPPPQPGPAELLAQVEMKKIESDMAVDAAKLELERDKFHADILLRAEEIEKKYNTPVDVALIRASVEQDRIARNPG